MTIRTWGRLAVITLAVVFVQVCVLNQVVVGGAHPGRVPAAGDLGRPRGRPATRGRRWVSRSGLVADVFVPTPYGLSSLCYVLVAFAVGLASGAATTGRPSASRPRRRCSAGSGGTLLFAGLGTLIGQPSVPHHQLVVIAVVVGDRLRPVRQPRLPAGRVGPRRRPGRPTGHAGAFASGSAR